MSLSYFFLLLYPLLFSLLISIFTPSPPPKKYFPPSLFSLFYDSIGQTTKSHKHTHMTLLSIILKINFCYLSSYFLFIFPTSIYIFYSIWGGREIYVSLRLRFGWLTGLYSTYIEGRGGGWGQWVREGGIRGIQKGWITFEGSNTG